MNTLITDAIRARRLIRFIYEGYERIVEPHMYGINSANQEMVSAFLVGGWTKTETQPGWRNFLVKEMDDVHALSESFRTPRPGYNAKDPQFRQIYCSLDAQGRVVDRRDQTRVEE